MGPRVGPELPVVAGGHEPVLRGDHLRALPYLGDLDVVDAMPPGVPPRVHGVVVEVSKRELVELTSAPRAELAILRLESVPNLRGEASLEVFLKKPV
jgi:hypothetical protein